MILANKQKLIWQLARIQIYLKDAKSQIEEQGVENRYFQLVLDILEQLIFDLGRGLYWKRTPFEGEYPQCEIFIPKDTDDD